MSRVFDKLFNSENENTTVQLDDSFDDTNRHFVRRIQESKVRKALKRMKGGKAMGLMVSQSRCGDVSGYSYSMANQDVQPYLLIEQDA